MLILVPRGVEIALVQDRVDDAVQAADRAAAPVTGNGGVFGAVERPIAAPARD